MSLSPPDGRFLNFLVEEHALEYTWSVPELAEVQASCDGIAALVGDSLSATHIMYPRWLRLGDPQDTIGQTLLSINRWGKRLRFQFTNDIIWVGSLGMTGHVTLDQQQSQEKHCMFTAVLGEHTLWWYDPRRFGSLYCFESTADADEWGLDKIGLDAAQRWSPQQIAQRFTTTIALKTALLQQQRIAGLGNYLVDEILWDAQLHPLQPSNTITIEQWKRFNRSRLKIIRAALAHGGLSIRDYLHPDGTGGTMIDQLHAYSRAGQPCHRCGISLVSQSVAGRMTVWCCACQRRTDLIDLQDSQG